MNLKSLKICNLIDFIIWKYFFIFKIAKDNHFINLIKDLRFYVASLYILSLVGDSEYI
jgi:hypothetical protein